MNDYDLLIPNVFSYKVTVVHGYWLEAIEIHLNI